MVAPLALNVIGISRGDASVAQTTLPPISVQTPGEQEAPSPGRDATMPQPLGLAAVRRQQRRVTALLRASNQLNIVVPERRNIPYDELHKSDCYLQLQARFRQMLITGSRPTARSLPDLTTLTRPPGDAANRDRLPPSTKAGRRRDVGPLGSTREGWKRLRESREHRESAWTRNRFNRSKEGPGMRQRATARGTAEETAGWCPDQATRQTWTEEKIKKQRNELSSRDGASRATTGVRPIGGIGGGESSAGSRVDYRLPRVPKLSPTRVPLPGYQTRHAPGKDDAPLDGASVAGQPLLRYNHGNIGQGMDLSHRTAGRDDIEEAEWSPYPDVSDDTYRPFFPKTPSASPASLYTGDDASTTGEFGQAKGRESINLDLRNSEESPRDREEDRWVPPSPESASRLGSGEPDFGTTRDAVDGGTRAPVRRGERGSFARQHPSTETSGLAPYRDAYARALSVARSRCLPLEASGLGTRTSRAFSFSYFRHRAACKCQECLGRALAGSSNGTGKRPEGLRKILGDVRMEDYYPG